MSATALLNTLTSRGIVARVENGDLKLRPAHSLDVEMLAAVRAAKAELLTLLTATLATATGVAAATDAPPALQKMPGMELCDAGPLLGLWLWRGWCVPPRRMPAYRRSHQQRGAAASGAAAASSAAATSQATGETELS